MNKDTNSVVPFSSAFGVGTLNGEVQSLIDKMFDSFWQEPSFLTQRNWRACQVTEDKDMFKVEIELPGFSKTEISVSVVGNSVKVAAKNKKSTYSRVFSVAGWDASKLKSSLKDGILYLEVPKSEAAKEKFVDIEELK